MHTQRPARAHAARVAWWGSGLIGCQAALRRPGLRVWMAAGALAVAGCASTPPPAVSSGGGVPRPVPRPAPAAQVAPDAGLDRDGPGASPPPDLMAVPDAQPQVEPVRSGGANKPYEVLGQAYTPLQGDPPLVQRGLASWYGRKFHGRSTANGETYNMYAMTAAHKTMPLPSYARVRNPANGREVVVRINDRGPFHPGRMIDLSYAAAFKLGVLAGVAPVEIERITYQAIRTGAWRTPDTPALAAAASSAAAGAVASAASSAAAVAVASAASSAAAVAVASAASNAATVAVASAASSAATVAVASAAAAEAAAAAAPAPAGADNLAPPTRADMQRPTTTAEAAEAADARPALRAARGYWLQLGAFAQRDGAMGFQQRVASQAGWLAPLMAIFTERNLHRLQAGPYASRTDAHAAAERLRATLSLAPVVLERR